MTKIRLGVNIDHVATVRNAREETYPNPLKAALLAQKSGADSITIHLREDRRHIRYSDLINIKKKIKIPLNLEMAPTKEMLNIALRNKPNFVCIVPEKRKEITTEGGLNLNRKNKFLKNFSILNKNCCIYCDLDFSVASKGYEREPHHDRDDRVLNFLFYFVRFHQQLNRRR